MSIEQKCQETIASLRNQIGELERKRAACRTRKERRPINQSIHHLTKIVVDLERMGGGGL